mmetsp:Transcript_26203/g.38819  ORF Transcript_26203/g.38819 Transcript_26203/m.38819 type:complete len:231 (-) Transcript_26203:312-1004(-)
MALSIALRTVKIPSLIHAYFQKRPILANSCSGFGTFAVGDILSQMVAQSSEGNNSATIDVMRAVRTGTVGVLMNGFMLHFWYRSLDRIFGSAMKNVKMVVFKCFVDQLVYAPFSIGVFFTYASINRGGSIGDIYDTMTKKSNESFLETWAADCMIWPWVNFLNFRFVPIYMRPTFIGMAQVMWQTYLSTVGHKECAIDIDGIISAESVDEEEHRDSLPLTGSAELKPHLT